MLEYLSKKGYSRTEATLRQESAQHDVDGRPKYKTVQDRGGDKYDVAFSKHLTQCDDTDLLFTSKYRAVVGLR